MGIYNIKVHLNAHAVPPAKPNDKTHIVLKKQLNTIKLCISSFFFSFFRLQIKTFVRKYSVKTFIFL